MQSPYCSKFPQVYRAHALTIPLRIASTAVRKTGSGVPLINPPLGVAKDELCCVEDTLWELRDFDIAASKARRYLCSGWGER